MNKIAGFSSWTMPEMMYADLVIGKLDTKVSEEPKKTKSLLVRIKGYLQLLRQPKEVRKFHEFEDSNCGFKDNSKGISSIFKNFISSLREKFASLTKKMPKGEQSYMYTDETRSLYPPDFRPSKRK